MRRVALPLLALLVWPGAAPAENVYPGQVSDARIASGPGGTLAIGYLLDGNFVFATRSGRGWTNATLGLPRSDVELDGLQVGPGNAQVTALFRSRDGSWLALWDGERITSFRRDSQQARFGPAGLTLDRSGRPVVAYALWFPSRKTYLRLAQRSSSGVYSARRVTRKGVPPSSTLPGAAPVLLPSGEIRVVETYLPAAIEWRPIPGDWRGQFLHSSALGVPVGTVSTAVADSVLYAAWTEAYPTLGPPAVVLASHGSTTTSSVIVEDAVLAGLAVTPQGPEVAANRCIPAVAFGLTGDGVCGGLVGAAGLDGIVAGFAVAEDGSHELLLDSATGLDWFHSPGPLSVRVTLNQDLTGRVDGASGGEIQLYRERPGQRTLLGSFSVAADGSFAAGDPTATPVVAAYRAVYVDAATGIPYAALIGPPVS